MGYKIVSCELFPHRFTVTKNQAFQLSLVGRALPNPPARVVLKSYNDFMDLATSNPFTALNSSLCNSKALSWAAKQSKHLGPASMPGISASNEFTRKEGGALNAMFQSGHVFVKLENLADKDATKRVAAPPTSRLQMMAKRTARTSISLEMIKPEFIRRFSGPNRAKVVVLAERGYKTRPVTCSQPELVSEAHRYRRKLWHVLLRIKQISRYLGSPPKVIPLDGGQGSIYSADFSQATDGLTHLWLEWFCNKFRVPHELVWKDMLVEGQPYTRGAMMGMPVSWCILSLTHWAIAKESGLSRFAIRGDDLIARMTTGQFRTYQVLAASVGFKINLSKTFVSRSAGVFCETHYVVRSGGKELHMIPHCPLRFVNPSGSAVPIIDLQMALRQVLSNGFNCSKLHLITKISHPQLYVQAAKLKMNPYLPGWAGGVGLPPPSSRTKIRYKDRAKIRWALTHGLSLPSLFPTTGNHLRKLTLALSGLSWSISTSDPCPCYREVIGKLYSHAFLFDKVDGSFLERPIPFSKWLKMQSQRYLRLPQAHFRRGKDDRPPRYLDLLHKEIYPSRKSMKLAGHLCLAPSGTTQMRKRRDVQRTEGVPSFT